MCEQTIGKMCRRGINIQIILDLILWITVSLPVFYLFLNGKPYQSGFFCDDPSLSYPYKPSSISTPILIAVGLALSIVVVSITELLNCLDTKCRRTCRNKDSIMSCVKSYIVFLIGFLVEEMFVEVVKNTFGALRPNFFAVCNPQFNRTLCPGYISEYSCSRDEGDRIIRNSRQAFPSGHAAFSMYVAVYYSIYIEKRLQIRFSRLLKIFLQSGLVLVALLCGLGRIKDHKHHSSDVIAGFIVGASVGVFIQLCLGEQILKTDNNSDTSKTITKTKQRDSCKCKKSSYIIQDESSAFQQNESSRILEITRDSSSAKLLSNNNQYQQAERDVPNFQIEDV